MNNLTTIEKKVIQHFKDSVKIKGINIKKYTGEFDNNSAERVSFKAPALFVSFLGAKCERTAAGGLLAESRWAAWLVLHSAGKQDNQEKQLLSNVISEMNGSNLGLKALPIHNLLFEQILARQLEKGNLAAWLIRWEHDLKLLTPVDTSTAPDQIFLSHGGDGAGIDTYQQINS